MSLRKVSEQEIKKRFGDRLREMRKKKGMSQEQLALEIEMDLTSVNEIEKGHRSPKLITIYKLSQALGTSMSNLTDL